MTARNSLDNISLFGDFEERTGVNTYV